MRSLFFSVSLAFTTILSSVVGCGVSSSGEEEDVAHDENALRSEVGSIAFEFEGATINLTSRTGGYALKFEGAIRREGMTTEPTQCFLTGEASGDTTLLCGPGYPARFAIKISGANGAASIGLTDIHRLGVEGDPDANPIPILGLRTMDAKPLTIGAKSGIEPLSLARTIHEAVATAGRFSTPTNDGALSVSSWSFLDPEVNLTLKLEPATSTGTVTAPKRIACYSSSNSPKVWATAGSVQAGIASPTVLAERIKTASAWMHGNCTHN